MGQVIASTYEIEHEIGSGGGGIVYLGRHLRLGKWVVLKADKRTLSAKPEVLRREVDALKDLSHTYIPQVYDFVAEGGVVYTVMDYIEGESLNKPLERGERFPQARIIEWACEILEALVYLHSRPPYGILHGDIKPANIMLTPQGDIRLIDFNIALALGEKGAVQVGFSRGYASPEHYGVDYRAKVQTASESPETVVEDSTVVTRMGGESRQANGGGARATVRLDVRSDIYSLGATLYHLLAGEKPAQDAKEVKPLSQFDFVSPAVAGIVQKAMEPDPDRRYQTAAEMLYALEHLRENDPRSKAHKRRRNITAGVLAVLFLTGGGMTFAGLGQMERVQAAAAQEAQEAQTALSEVRSAEEAFQNGDLPEAKRHALSALTIDSPYQAPAQKVLTDALGVYDLTDGLKPYRTVELPTETLKLELSPEGSRLAALYAYQLLVVDTASGDTLAQLPTRPTAVSDFLFLDENTLLYAGEDGLTAYDAAAGTALWTGEIVTRLTVSEDGTRAAGLNAQRDGVVVYSLADGQDIQTISFQGARQRMPAGDGILADPEDELLILNGDGTLLAASLEGGGLSLFDVENGERWEIYDASDYTHFEGGFYGNYFTFSAWNDKESVLLVYNTETMSQVGGFSAQTPFRTRSDSRGIYVAADDLLVALDPETGEQRELAYPGADIIQFRMGEDGSVLVAMVGDGYALFNGNARLITQGALEKGCELLDLGGPYAVFGSLETPTVRLMQMETHQEASLATYDPALPHQEARLSADGATVTYFQYDRVDVLDQAGGLIAHLDMPDAQTVYDQQFRRDEDGSRLEVTWEDGTVRAYSASDGALIWEHRDPPPDESLHETFQTTRWRIESPLHGAATVYDKTTGEAFTQLEKESYLTYVTEVGDYLVTQYISAQGKRYGLLLDQECRTLAELPGLCDVWEDQLIFDDDMGHIRQRPIYSLQELKDMAR